LDLGIVFAGIGKIKTG